MEKAFVEITTKVFEFKEVGDCITGVYKEAVDGIYGKDYVINSGGEDYTVFNTTVLTTKMSKVKVGDTIRITYLGDVAPKIPKGNPYKNFKVEREE